MTDCVCEKSIDETENRDLLIENTVFFPQNCMLNHFSWTKHLGSYNKFYQVCHIYEGQFSLKWLFTFVVVCPAIKKWIQSVCKTFSFLFRSFCLTYCKCSAIAHEITTL